MISRRTLCNFAAVAIALTSHAAPAAADPVMNRIVGDTETRSLEVRYKDLNLGEEAGQATLKARVAAAAHQVCRYWAQPWPVERACRIKTYRDAEPAILAAIEKSTGTQFASSENR